MSLESVLVGARDYKFENEKKTKITIDIDFVCTSYYVVLEDKSNMLYQLYLLSGFWEPCSGVLY